MEKFISYIQNYTTSKATTYATIGIAVAFALGYIAYLTSDSSAILQATLIALCLVNTTLFCSVVGKVLGTTALIAHLQKENMFSWEPTGNMSKQILLTFAVTLISIIIVAVIFSMAWEFFIAWIIAGVIISSIFELLQVRRRFYYLVNPTAAYKENLIWITQYIKEAKATQGLDERSKIFIYNQVSNTDESAIQMRNKLGNGSCTLKRRTDNALKKA